MFKLKILKVSVISTLVALCVATNYALVGVYNVKVMDFIVFVGGFCFGPIAGALIGILSWAVYGVINPYGFIPQIWLATMFSEPIYGLVGGFLSRNLNSTDFNDRHLQLSILFGVSGFFSTLIYDLITNVVYALTFDIPTIVAIILGTPFTILHELSNTAIFVVGSVPLIIAVKNSLGVEKFGLFAK